MSSSSTPFKRKSSVSSSSSNKKQKTAASSSASVAIQSTAPIQNHSPERNNSAQPIDENTEENWTDTDEEIHDDELSDGERRYRRMKREGKMLNIAIGKETNVATESLATRAIMEKQAPSEEPPFKKPPVKEVFGTAWSAPEINIPGTIEAHWGVKPTSADAPPNSSQPGARDNNADTNPPLWEHRGFKYARGDRFRPYFGSEESKPTIIPTTNNCDQRDYLQLKLLDMRAGPNLRKPVVWSYMNGEPNDWKNAQAIKKLNDSRREELDKHADELQWRQHEMNVLSNIINENRDGSIWLWTQRFNDFFIGNESCQATFFVYGIDQWHTGRTVESVRYQYLTYKPTYDDGNAPDVAGDKNNVRIVNYRHGKDLKREVTRQLALEDTFQAWGKNLASLAKWRRARNQRWKNTESEDEEDAAYHIKVNKAATADMRAQAKLDDPDEALLAMGVGGYSDSPAGEPSASADIDDDLRDLRVASSSDDEASEMSDVPDGIEIWGPEFEREFMDVDSNDSNDLAPKGQIERQDAMELTQEPEDDHSSEDEGESHENIETVSSRSTVQSTAHDHAVQVFTQEIIVRSSSQMVQTVVEAGSSSLSIEPNADIVLDFPPATGSDDDEEGEEEGSHGELGIEQGSAASNHTGPLPHDSESKNEQLSPKGLLDIDSSEVRLVFDNEDEALPAQSPEHGSLFPVRSPPPPPARIIEIDEQYSDSEHGELADDEEEL